VSENGRWNSPKYLIGESYGTTRGAGIVNYLQSNENMSFNGIVLISTAMDMNTLFDGIAGHELPYALYLPTYSAVAWYHHKLPDQNTELNSLLEKVRKFALGDYIHALLEGNTITEQERNDIAEKLHEYTGLSKDYILQADLRIREGEFTQQLLNKKRETVGRIDARIKGFTFDPLSQYADYDPLFPAVSPAYTASFLNYIHNDLNFGKDMDYSVIKSFFRKWKWTHTAASGEFQFVANTSVDLAYAVDLNPYLKVLVMQGYFDLATPFLATEYTFSHMNVNKKLLANIEIKYYQAGHMMYIHKPSLEKMKKDLDEFYDASDRIK
jgi:carboxypeptidase C (cathepsin A)